MFRISNPMHSFVVALLAVSALILCQGAHAQQTLPVWECEKIRDATLLHVVPPEQIPPIDKPEFVSATEADKFMTNAEPVLGIFDGTVAKAYSLWQLDRHEVVNDSTTGLGPIAVTW